MCFHFQKIWVDLKSNNFSFISWQAQFIEIDLYSWSTYMRVNTIMPKISKTSGFVVNCIGCTKIKRQQAFFQLILQGLHGFMKQKNKTAIIVHNLTVAMCISTLPTTLEELDTGHIESNTNRKKSHL